MQFEIWNKLEKQRDEKNPFLQGFKFDDGSEFYLEPLFLTQLEGLAQRRPEDMNKIYQAMEEIVHKHKKVVFIADDEESMSEVDGAIYRTIFDITDPLLIFVEDKSRGSDYGD